MTRNVNEVLMKNIYKQYFSILVSILVLSIIWEFWIEGYVHPLEQEPFAEKVEYVVTVFVFGLLALIVPFRLSKRSERARREIELDREKLIHELHDTIKTIKKLEGIIPICARCKHIRDEEGAWSALEIYIRDHSEAQFSHGLCPSCEEKAVAELEL